MKKLLSVCLVSLLSLFLIFLFVSSNSAKNQEGFAHQEEYVPNEVLVKFKKDVSKYFIQDAVNSIQGKIITFQGKEISSLQWSPDIPSLRSFRLDPDLFHVKVPETIGTEQAIDVLSKNPSVKYAEKNGIFHAETIPNDTHFDKLWGLHNTGQAEGTVDADIDAPEAWDIFTGSSDIVVAVIDSGVDYNHEDLAANIWINWDEYNGTPGVDDDSNGYVDDVYGWDFVNNDNDPMDDYSYMEIYHGTHVSGTIGAQGNNGKGVTGVNWNVRIMVLKSLDAYGGGTTANLVQAIDYSTDNGAHLSNNSWGGYDYSQSMYYAITRAMNAGKLFIAAAGNDGLDTDQTRHYPSCYSHDNIISVAATNNKDELSIRSNYGARTVDLGAPGGWWVQSGETPNEDDIYSTKRYDDYQFLYATSMATPHVSGVAALVWGYYPAMDYKQVKCKIFCTVDPKSSLSGKVASGGRLNAYNSLTTPSEPAAPSNLTGYGDCFDVLLWWEDNSDNECGFKIEKKIGTSFVEIGQVGPNSYSYEDRDLMCDGLYFYRVRAYNADGDSPYSNVESARTKRCRWCGFFSLEITPDKEIINSGESVTYIYEVENKGNVDLTDVELIDDKLGKIAAKFTLKKGETKTFTKTVVLTKNTTNSAEATATYHYENKTEIIKSHANATVEIRK